MSEWQSIDSAPKDGSFWVFNIVTGPYITTRNGEDFPMKNWGPFTGVWYPRPTQWSDFPIDQTPEPPK